MFRVLGVAPLLGRWPDADSRIAYGNREVVLGYDLWMGRFGGNPNVPGTDINLAGNPHRIVGVMPPGFTFPDRTQVWLPHPYGTKDYGVSYASRNLNVIGRLKPGVAIEAAQAEAAAISARAAAAEPRNRGWSSQVHTAINEMTFAYRQGFVILSVAVVIVLLIACANLSNLLLATLEGRSSEMALRAALGASRKDLFGQVLRESLALSICGGVLGLIFVMWGLDLLRPIIPANIPRADSIRADLPVALFSLAASMVTGLLFSLLPGLRASEARLGGALRSGTGRTSTVGGGLRGGLVAVQVALAIVLLSGAGLLMNTLRRLAEQELGFRRDHLLVAQIPLSSRARYGNDAQKAAFAEDFLRRLSEEPGVRTAGPGYPLPFTGGQEGRLGIEVDGRPGLELGIVQYRSFT
ncbi:MAG: ABC transporter permease, partial [Acidobacteriia bacterium]|nr:ABC transporter permease [Terriglobia bacterium]